MPLVHFVGLLRVMTRTRSMCVRVAHHVSPAHPERSVLILLFVYFLDIKVCSRLVIGSRAQILIAVSGGLCSDDLIWIVHWRVQVLLLLLLLNGSLEDQDIVGRSSRQLMEGGALVVLQVVVRGPRKTWVCHKILFYCTLSGWFKTGRFMIVGWRRLGHLVGPRARRWTVV